MTKQLEPDRLTSRDRPVVEITDEMKAAGVLELAFWLDGASVGYSQMWCEQIVISVFETMALENHSRDRCKPLRDNA